MDTNTKNKGKRNVIIIKFYWKKIMQTKSPKKTKGGRDNSPPQVPLITKHTRPFHIYIFCNTLSD